MQHSTAIRLGLFVLFGAVAGAAVVLCVPDVAEAALRNAAGGGDGAGGFATLTRYLDRLASFLIPVGGAAAVIGRDRRGLPVHRRAARPRAKMLGYVAVGVVIVLASKGLAA